LCLASTAKLASIEIDSIDNNIFCGNRTDEIICIKDEAGNVHCGVHDEGCQCSYPTTIRARGPTSNLTSTISELANLTSFALGENVDTLEIKILSLNSSTAQTQMQNNIMQ
jgi:hypothetical protein